MMDDRTDRMFAENARIRDEMFNADWSSFVDAANNWNKALRSIGRNLYLHMHPEIEQQRQYRRQQQELRTHVHRQCDGMKRRRRR